MYIWFTVKTFYMAVIAFLVSVLQGAAAFGVLRPFFENEAILGEMFQPFWFFSFGFILFLVESWWKFSDPEATTFLMIAPLRVWEIFIMGGGLIWIIQRLLKEGFNKQMLIMLAFAAATNLLFFGIYEWKASRVRKHAR